jgi:hypothetical protein
MLKGSESVLCASESLTVIMIVVVPVLVGIPLMIPVDELMFKLAGKVLPDFSV